MIQACRSKFTVGLLEFIKSFTVVVAGTQDITKSQVTEPKMSSRDAFRSLLKGSSNNQQNISDYGPYPKRKFELNLKKVELE